MNYKQNIKKQSVIIVICAVLLTIVAGGTSYALFFQINTNTENQVVQAGTLSVTYGEGSTSISETGLVPITDTEALNSTTLFSTIYVENKGTLPADYVVKIGNDLESFQSREDYSSYDELLAHEYIKIAVQKNGVDIIGPTRLSDLTSSNDASNMYHIHSGSLDVLSSGENSDTFTIKVWVSSSNIVTPDDLVGKYIYLKVDVTSVVDESSTPEGQNS